LRAVNVCLVLDLTVLNVLVSIIEIKCITEIIIYLFRSCVRKSGRDDFYTRHTRDR